MKQELVWIPQGIQKSGYDSVQVPLVDFPFSKPDRLWTLYLEQDLTKKPTLPFQPRHLVNAFLEDHFHDWRLIQGKLKYYSRVSEGGHWVLLEWEDEKSN